MKALSRVLAAVFALALAFNVIAQTGAPTTAGPFIPVSNVYAQSATSVGHSAVQIVTLATAPARQYTSGPQYLIFNAGPGTAYVTLQPTSTVATLAVDGTPGNAIAIPSYATFVLSAPVDSFASSITASPDTATLYIIEGVGQ